MPGAKAPPPARLTKQQYTAYALGLPIGFIALAVGLVGMVVLMDTDQKLAISHTDFAQFWRKVVHKNPFTQAFLVNFGGIGCFYSLFRLVSHHRAAPAPARQAGRQPAAGRKRQQSPVKAKKEQ